MNLKDIWHKQFFKASKIAGVDIQINSDGAYSFSFVVLKMQRNNLSIVKSKSAIRSIDELISNLSKENCPLVLSLNGKGIIYKSLNEKFAGTYQDALQKVFPSGNEHEFHVQLFHGFNDNAFIAVIRNQALDEILALFKSSKLPVINIVLGMYSLELLVAFLQDQSSLQKINLDSATI